MADVGISVSICDGWEGCEDSQREPFRGGGSPAPASSPTGSEVVCSGGGAESLQRPAETSGKERLQISEG